MITEITVSQERSPGQLYDSVINIRMKIFIKVWEDLKKLNGLDPQKEFINIVVSEITDSIEKAFESGRIK